MDKQQNILCVIGIHAVHVEMKGKKQAPPAYWRTTASLKLTADGLAYLKEHAPKVPSVNTPKAAAVIRHQLAQDFLSVDGLAQLININDTSTRYWYPATSHNLAVKTVDNKRESWFATYMNTYRNGVHAETTQKTSLPDNRMLHYASFSALPLPPLAAMGSVEIKKRDRNMKLEMIGTAKKTKGSRYTIYAHMAAQTVKQYN